jgi:hypothetical protein
MPLSADAIIALVALLVTFIPSAYVIYRRFSRPRVAESLTTWSPTHSSALQLPLTYQSRLISTTVSTILFQQIVLSDRPETWLEHGNQEATGQQRRSFL